MGSIEQCGATGATDEEAPTVTTARIDQAINIQLRKYFIAAFEGQDPTAVPYHSSKNNRETIEYGYSYRHMHNNDTLTLANHIPFVLTMLFDAVRSSVAKVSKIDIPETFDNCLVNRYRTGVDLFPHVDNDRAQATKEHRSFYFGDTVVGVTLVADEDGGLYIQRVLNGELARYDPHAALRLKEEDGMAYLLSCRNRHAPWHHGVSPVKNLRLSATFRTLHRLSASKAHDTRMLVPPSHYCRH